MTTEIDWSKAPEWANVRLRNVITGHKCWAAAYEDGATFGRENMRMSGLKTVLWVLIATRPAPWNGEGLPPIGSECLFDTDMDDGTDWHVGLEPGMRVEVIAHFHAGACEVAAFVFTEAGGRQVEQATAECFRPLRTPEQIAADERLDAIEAICREIEGDTAKWNVSLDASVAMRAVVEAMHDKGYRK